MEASSVPLPPIFPETGTLALFPRYDGRFPFSLTPLLLGKTAVDPTRYMPTRRSLDASLLLSTKRGKKPQASTVLDNP